MTLTMKCDIDNDLYLCLKSAEVPCMRYDSALDAVSHAPVGSGVMLLADRYPCRNRRLRFVPANPSPKVKIFGFMSNIPKAFPT